MFLSFSFETRFRFCELYYRRKGRTQTVVIYLPDVRSCLPTRFEWDELSVKYKKHLEMKKQHGESEESMESGDKMHSKLEETLDDAGNNADVEMVDKSSKLEKKSSNDGENQSHDKVVDSSEGKAADSESGSTSGTTTISKALLKTHF